MTDMSPRSTFWGVFAIVAALLNLGITIAHPNPISAFGLMIGAGLIGYNFNLGRTIRRAWIEANHPDACFKHKRFAGDQHDIRMYDSKTDTYSPWHCELCRQERIALAAERWDRA